MKKKGRIALITALAAVFAVSGGMLLYEFYQYRQGEETYAEAEELAALPDFSDLPEASGSSSTAASSSGAARPVYVDPYAEELRNMDFAALRQVNSDILGWILIPNTVISYPLLQTEDNSYYLKHTWKKWSGAVGAIFLEHQCSGDFSDFNTIVYGHNMNNGSMFGTLKKYKDPSYFKAHPYVYITTDAGASRYEIFAAYEVSTAGDTYLIGTFSEGRKQAFLDYCAGLSVIDTGVTPTVHDRILTLSTCTGRGHATRWVVQARLEGTAPAEETPPAEGAASPEEPTPADPAQSGAASGGAAEPAQGADPPAEGIGVPAGVGAVLPADGGDASPQTDSPSGEAPGAQEAAP